MGITRLTWRIRRLCRHWTPLVYLLLGILVIQAFLTFHSGPNLVEEEERLRLRRLARIDQHNELAQSMLKGEKSLLANKLNGGGPEGGNAHDPKFRERFVHGAKSDVYIIEDHDQPMAMEKDTGRLKSPAIDEPNIDANRAVIEAPYAPRCEVEHKDAVSAISRATTSRCKQEIADTACKAQNGTLFPATMPRFCPHDYKYSGQAPIPQQYEKDLPQIKICFMLVVHGRAVRQFKRLLKVLYHSDHYFYIHVDKRSNHLHREILKIAPQYPNVKVAKWRMATIWGGSSLLQMLMRAMNDVLSFWKDWNFFINLSALDFPIETNDKLVNFLATYNTKNFMKSHGRDDEKFIRKQGLNRIFVECDQHMWRLGERELPGGITLNGGSDWIALNRDFCDYVINGNDALLTSLKHWYQYTLLPAESFFHTLAQNSLKCETFVDNNLRVTNWNRARGCKCQYKHIVDWCGCSPNDFYPSDLFRLQTARPVFFARKFEESINQEVVNHLDFKLYGEYPRNTPALYSYWENVFDHLDETLPNDALLTHYHSFGRMGLAKISPATNDDASDNECLLRPIKLETVEMYRHQEEFKGYIVTLNAKWMREDERLPLSGSVDSVKLQAWISLKPQLNILDKSSVLASRLQWAAVGTNWDVKELVLRDWGGIVGTLSEPRLVAKWSQSKEDFIVTVVLIDPLNVVADYNDFKTPAKSAGVTDTPLSLKKPLRPGKWKVRFYAQRQFQKVAAELTFIVSPLQFKSGAIGDVSLATDNRGVVSDDELNSATRNLYSIRTTLNLRRDYGAEESMEERATYIGEDLESWVDEVIGESWQANDVCVASADPSAWTAALARDISCDKRKKFSPMLCKNAQWSTLSPDPKSELTHIKPNGRIR